VDRSYLNVLLLGHPGDDERVRGARVAAALFVGAALIVLATLPMLPSAVSPLPVALMAGTALGVGLAIPKLPWARWGAGALLWLPVLGYVLLAVTGVIAPGSLAAYGPLYSVTFVYLGLVARPGLPLRFAPLAIASYLVGNSHDLGSRLVPLAIAAPLWCLIGEMLARALAYRTRELERAAETDALTRLENRRSFDRALDAMEPGDAVVLLDLDHFKAVNDRYGHQAGDEALRRLADAMRSVTRNIDCVARYGGEEFAMVLARAGIAGAKDVVRRLRREWRPAETATFSAGIAVNGSGETAPATLARADAALYEAKAKGRDRVEVARGERPAPRQSRSA
jgi:diguanylate cyclase (GGDEF)-like protein